MPEDVINTFSDTGCMIVPPCFSLKDGELKAYREENNKSGIVLQYFIIIDSNMQ